MYLFKDEFKNQISRRWQHSLCSSRLLNIIINQKTNYNLIKTYDPKIFYISNTITTFKTKPITNELLHSEIKSCIIKILNRNNQSRIKINELFTNVNRELPIQFKLHSIEKLRRLLSIDLDFSLCSNYVIIL